jgi:aspartate/methionine/tyrosine aminotransferase
VEIKRERLGDWFIFGRQTGYKYALASVGRPALKLRDVMEALDPEMTLDWSGHWFGPPVLLERIIKSLGYNVTPDCILPVNGTYEANWLPLLALLGAGDEVILEMPAWMQVDTVCEGLGCTIKHWELRQENKWKPNLDDLKRLITNKTKLIYINHPNNPTGSILTAAEMDELCAVARKHGIYVLSDEIYRGLEWDGPMSPSVVNHYERGISAASVTKLLGMSGLRLGWMVTKDKALYDRCFPIHRYAVQVTNVLAERIGAYVLEPTKFTEILESGKQVGRRNLEMLRRWIERSKVFSWVPSGGGYICFPRFDLPIDSWELCRRLITEEPYRVYLVPGVCYAPSYDNHIRIGFGVSPQTMEKALELVDQFTNALAAKV